MATTVLFQVVLLSAIMLLGYILGKKQYLTRADSNLLTKLLLDIFLPCSVLSSAGGNMGSDGFGQIILVISFYFAMLMLFTLIAFFFAKLLGMSTDDTLVFTRSIGYPNNGFMGIPLGAAVFGAQGTVWVSLTVPGTTIYLFFMLMCSFRREKESSLRGQLRSMINPLNLSVVAMLVMLAFNLQLPDIAKQFCSSLGGCLTPVAMLVIGYLLSESPLIDTLRRPVLYLTTLLRNLVCPLIGAFIFRFTPWDRDMCLCLVMIMGCSVASSVGIFAARHNRSPQFAGQAVLQSSLLLPITMPALMVLAEMILK